MWNKHVWDRPKCINQIESCYMGCVLISFWVLNNFLHNLHMFHTTIYAMNVYFLGTRVKIFVHGHISYGSWCFDCVVKFSHIRCQWNHLKCTLVISFGIFFIFFKQNYFTQTLNCWCFWFILNKCEQCGWRLKAVLIGTHTEVHRHPEHYLVFSSEGFY